MSIFIYWMRLKKMNKRKAGIRMALLVFSDKCNYSLDVLNFIKQNPSLGQMLRYHNVTTQGRPKTEKVTRVPTLITGDGQVLVGAEVTNWLESMVPSEIEMWDGSGVFSASLDGGDGGPDMFSLDAYGTSMQPMLTAELKDKINKDPKEAYQLKSSAK
jgi:hypothetical protein